MQKEVLIYSNGKQAQIFSDGKLYGKYITEIHFEHVSLESELRLVCTGVPVTGTTYELGDFRKKVNQLLKGKSEKKGMLIYSNGEETQVFVDGKLYGKSLIEVRFEHVDHASDLRTACMELLVDKDACELKDFRKKASLMFEGVIER